MDCDIRKASRTSKGLNDIMTAKGRRRAKRALLNLLGWIVIVVLAVPVFFYGRNIAYDKQMVVYDGLRNTSGIIFGVMGAWMAVLYPGGIASFFKDPRSASSQIAAITGAMVNSMLTLAVILLIQFLAPILEQFPFPPLIVSLSKGFSYSLVFVLTALQMRSLLITLLPNYIIKEDLVRQENLEELRKRLSGKDE